MPCSRMNHHTLRLVYKYYIIIFIYYIKRYVFRKNFKRLRLRYGKIYNITVSESVI